MKSITVIIALFLATTLLIIACNGAQPTVEPTSTEVSEGSDNLIPAESSIANVTSEVGNSVAVGNCMLNTDEDGFVHIPEGKITTANGLRIFWTIIVNPSAADANLNGLARKAVTLWNIEDGSARCLMKNEYLLVTEKICPREGSVDLHRPDGEIQLSDSCYLAIDDPGLSNQAGQMGLNLEEKLATSESIIGVISKFLSDVETGDIDHPQFQDRYYVGENIMLSVDFLAEGDGMNPLFHHEQFYSFVGSAPESGAIMAAERITDTLKAKAIWQVRREEPSVLLRDESIEYDVSGQRNLTVRQGLVEAGQSCTYSDGRESTVGQQPYFEFRLDSVEILGKACDGSSHLFSTGEVRFFVGYSPDFDPDTLQGSIKRIIFDPNSSCAGCM